MNSSNKDIIHTRKAIYYDIRLLPHGPITLIPAVIASLCVCLSISDDGCDYARLTGSAIELLTGSNIVPFVHVGHVAYRIPDYYPEDNTWFVPYTNECIPYTDVIFDSSWNASTWFRFMGMIVGMTTTMFLWTSTCLTLRPIQWRTCGLGAVLTCTCYTLSFVWFYTKLCSTTTTNYEDFAYGREVEMGQDPRESGYRPPTSCLLFFGSRCTLASCFLWALVASIVLLCKFTIQPRLMIYDEKNMIAMVPSSSSTTPPSIDLAKRRQSLRQSLRRQELNNHQSITMNMKPISRRPTFVDATPEELHTTTPVGGDTTTKVRASLRTSMRPTTVPTFKSASTSSRRIGGTSARNVENNESVVSDVSFVL